MLINNLSITTFFAGVFGLLLVFLSARVSMVRQNKQIALGTAKDKMLEHAVRAQANFVEYTPFFIILFALLELHDIANWLLIITGSMFLFGRISHAYGLGFLEVKSFKKGLKFRVLGTAITYSLLSIMSLVLIIKSL